jgi:RNA polymerase sigma-70 factor (ECF subfamily)
LPHRPISPSLIERLHRQADAARWQVTPARLGEVLTASATHALGERAADARAVERHVASLHLADLALACACAEGHEGAWEHFVREQRPVLYRAADAIDPSGGARDLADAIYADLFGMPKDGGERRSLFRYFHGRSSLSTWLRAVLAQRHVDRLRSTRRLDPLPEDESAAAMAAPERPVDPDRTERMARMRRALGRALAALSADDRLRLGCYYAREMTLAQTGKLLGEHEATVSRQLARTRRLIRNDVERILADEGLSEAAIAECFAAVVEDAGPLDLGRLLRKESALDRSKEEKEL